MQCWGTSRLTGEATGSQTWGRRASSIHYNTRRTRELNRRLNFDFGLSYVSLAIEDVEAVVRAARKPQSIQIETGVLATVDAT